MSLPPEPKYKLVFVRHGQSEYNKGNFSQDGQM